jgi:hypothetical protein
MLLHLRQPHWLYSSLEDWSEHQHPKFQQVDPLKSRLTVHRLATTLIALSHSALIPTSRCLSPTRETMSPLVHASVKATTEQNGCPTPTIPRRRHGEQR